MVDKHRYSYSGGVRAAEVGKWGREIARARYGALKYENGAPPPEDRPMILRSFMRKVT